MQFILFVLLGLLGGFIGGLFGVGGGIIVVPILVLIFGFTQHMAQGTMILTFILPSFILAAWTYYKAGHINIPVALMVAAGMILGTFLGAKYAHALPTPILKRMFGVLMLVLSLKLIFGK
ncbi:MAG: sulfite exporter TauE/SafE family protein [Candidatus Omnitrophica bacterium]|nr:sulfite exporter TauE/SafE family protein [Candidatus Omnitrophota bacterium]